MKSLLFEIKSRSLILSLFKLGRNYGFTPIYKKVAFNRGGSFSFITFQGNKRRRSISSFFTHQLTSKLLRAQILDREH